MHPVQPLQVLPIVGSRILRAAISRKLRSQMPFSRFLRISVSVRLSKVHTEYLVVSIPKLILNHDSNQLKRIPQSSLILTGYI